MSVGTWVIGIEVSLQNLTVYLKYKKNFKNPI